MKTSKLLPLGLMATIFLSLAFSATAQIGPLVLGDGRPEYPPSEASTWSESPATEDVDLDCNDLLNAGAIYDCNGCAVLTPDGMLNAPGGVLYLGLCDTNTPACDQIRFVLDYVVQSSGMYDMYGSSNSVFVVEEWDCDLNIWKPQDYKMGDAYIDGNVNMNGNIINMAGWGTNIIAEGVTGCILTGTNNGAIYIGEGSHGNVITATVGAGSKIEIGRDSSYNVIQARIDDGGGNSKLYIGNGCMMNYISADISYAAQLLLTNAVRNSSIAIGSMDGTFEIGNSYSLSLGFNIAGGFDAGSIYGSIGFSASGVIETAGGGSLTVTNSYGSLWIGPNVGDGDVVFSGASGSIGIGDVHITNNYAFVTSTPGDGVVQSFSDGGVQATHVYTSTGSVHIGSARLSQGSDGKVYSSTGFGAETNAVQWLYGSLDGTSGVYYVRGVTNRFWILEN